MHLLPRCSLFSIIYVVITLVMLQVTRGMPDDWTQRPNKNDAYLLSNSSLAWEDARRTCRSLGGELLTIKSVKERKWLEGQFGELTTKWWWIGVNDFDVEGEWKWVDGSSVNDIVIQWATTQPNHGEQYGEICAQYSNESKGLSDVLCKELRCSLCRNAKDNMPYWNERLLSWHDAYETCTSAKNKNSHLYWITTSEDMEKLTELAINQRNTNCSEFWIGLKRIKSQWKWTNEDRSLMNPKIAKWEPGKPEETTQEHCAALSGKGLLHDYACYINLPFICKKKIRQILPTTENDGTTESTRVDSTGVKTSDASDTTEFSSSLTNTELPKNLPTMSDQDFNLVTYIALGSLILLVVLLVGKLLAPRFRNYFRTDYRRGSSDEGPLQQM